MFAPLTKVFRLHYRVHVNREESSKDVFSCLKSEPINKLYDIATFRNSLNSRVDTIFIQTTTVYQGIEKYTRAD